MTAPSINAPLNLQPRAARLPRRITVIAALVGLTLSACGRDDSDPSSGGLTVGDSDKLEAAAERLDARDAPAARDDSVAFEREVRERLATENVNNSVR